MGLSVTQVRKLQGRAQGVFLFRFRSLTHPGLLWSLTVETPLCLLSPCLALAMVGGLVHLLFIRGDEGVGLIKQILTDLLCGAL